ncbi:response regulator [Spirosoma sp. KNUC1025]|uniref:response regulator n=1 Tax=Spirosoma sp. KNUC1025 TaxID=2894082 RepID=UPI001E4709E3|nr:response regulator [Spirosoma sp. KNUC1025]UFH57625.1 response regulator [Spirosoma sp. KNUC1025]
MQLQQATPTFDILVVDDEPPVSDLLKRIAQKEFPEANFISMQSAQQTLDYLQTRPDRPPQLILLDIDLHQAKDGLSFLPELRAHLKGAVPIIMLSVVDNKAKIEQAYDQGAVAYTQKPEDLLGWHTYVGMLRRYWHQLVDLPTREHPLN